MKLIKARMATLMNNEDLSMQAKLSQLTDGEAISQIRDLMQTSV